MKKKVIIIGTLVLLIIGILSIYNRTAAQKKPNLPKPEDMTGNEASAFMPKEVKNKPAPKGTNELRISGPVWVGE